MDNTDVGNVALAPFVLLLLLLLVGSFFVVDSLFAHTLYFIILLLCLLICKALTRLFTTYELFAVEYLSLKSWFSYIIFIESSVEERCSLINN